MPGTESILVTGANGFIGRRLVALLLDSGFKVRGAVRSRMGKISSHPAYEQVEVGDIGPETDWEQAVKGAKAVVHLAARVHVMNEDAKDPKALYERVNVLGTKTLAAAAARDKVERLIYASTVKVHGSEREERYTEDDPLAPDDAYGRSKAEAEALLFSIEDFPSVALRPPLVYGPGVRGNFLALMRLVARGLPLPFGKIGNKRSMIHVDNFASAVIHCLTTTAPLSGPFLLRDGRDLSTPELVTIMAKAMGKTARLFPVPPSLLNLAAALAGKQEQARRLIGSLRVDDSRLRSTGWTPPLDPEQGLAGAVRWFRQQLEAS